MTLDKDNVLQRGISFGGVSIEQLDLSKLVYGVTIETPLICRHCWP